MNAMSPISVDHEIDDEQHSDVFDSDVLLSVAEPSPFKGWWRWPLIPIASPIGSVVGSTLIWILLWISMKICGLYSEDGWYYLYIVPLIISGVFGYLWCFIASGIAPRGKTITGTVMATILAMLNLFIILLSFTQIEKTTGERVQLLIACIATLIGSIIAVMQTHEEENKSEMRVY